MATSAHIQSEARGIHGQAPNLTTGVYLSPSLRGQLEDLAVLCGLPQTLTYNANDNDLISVYLTALKNGGAAQRVAARIRTRLDAPKGIFDEPAPEPETYEPEAPKPPTAQPGVSLHVVRDLIKKEVKEGALDPLQAALDRTVETFFAELGRVPLQAADTALAAMRGEITTAAHAAALEALKSLAPTMLEITRPEAPNPVSLGIVHRQTQEVIEALADGVNLYLHGPAGSGKTTVARQCATAFGTPFYMAAKVESEYLLLGFKDARGETVRTPFREAFEHGGVFLFDELDRSATSAVTALNSAHANGICAFPDALVTMHPDYKCIAAGNTPMTGASRTYVAAQQMDASVIDRFAFLEFGYDEDMERALASDASWCEYVQRVRAVVKERGLSHLVTPRATIEGCKLLRSGKRTREKVASMVVFKGLDADTVRQIQAAL